MKPAFLSFLVLSVVVAQALGLRCYDCKKSSNPECATNPEKFNTNCADIPNSPDRNVCVKITWKGEHNDMMLERKCSSESKDGSTDACEATDYNVNVKPGYTCSKCYEDLCNSSSKVGSAFYIFSIPMLILLITSR